SAVLAAFQWKMPPPDLWPWLVGMGFLATLVQMTMTKAFSVADVTAVMPFDFTKLIFTAIMGFAVYAEIPEIWVWIGGVIIFSATVYSTRREARRSRQ
ncbi:MAG: EamA family transporter, partial [Alphaproteobacteria bacterium]|nr:EamA family transporter [Alphaproteobacteria bacterium]